MNKTSLILALTVLLGFAPSRAEASNSSPIDDWRSVWTVAVEYVERLLAGLDSLATDNVQEIQNATEEGNALIDPVGFVEVNDQQPGGSAIVGFVEEEEERTD